MAFNFNSINSLQEFNNIFQKDVNQITASLEEQMEFEKAFNEATARQNRIDDKLSMRTNIDVRLDTINANKIENLSDSTRMMNAFGDSIKGSINSLNESQRNAERAVETLASGGDISIHEVMIAQEKSSLAMQMAIQLRNQALNTYNEFKNMNI
ncbi:flagellar hook-basal body complex protein FliE [bacterium]|nr:flagellar hook-basal body complex protein FliE [bacterium]